MIFVCSLIFLIGIWAWAIFYTAYNARNPNEPKRILSLLNFDSYPDHLVARYVKNSQIVKFNRPNGQNDESDMGTIKIGGNAFCVCVRCWCRRRDVFNTFEFLLERFQRFKSFFLNNDANRIMDTPDNNDNREKEENRRIAANSQRIYEHELQRMVF